MEFAMREDLDDTHDRGADDPQLAHAVESDLLRTVLEAVTDAVVILDASDCVQRLNPVAEALLGCSSAEAEGRSFDEIIARNSKSGEKRISATGVEIHGQGNIVQGRVLILRDEIQARQLVDRDGYTAQHDPLTGLPNRILLVDRLEQATRFADRNNDSVALVFLSLDSFREILQASGTTTADDLLKEVADRLTASLRESDTVSRLGADEFVLMLPGICSREDVDIMAAKLLAEIARPYAAHGPMVQTSCSIGISMYPTDCSDVATLMRLADAAMYQAKQGGGNRYKFAEPTIETAAAIDQKLPE
jgi:diguanylate cyclase (GGDEF)-like protein/PAS domain S-box-containing protein